MCFELKTFAVERAAKISLLPKKRLAIRMCEFHTAKAFDLIEDKNASLSSRDFYQKPLYYTDFYTLYDSPIFVY